MTNFADLIYFLSNKPMNHFDQYGVRIGTTDVNGNHFDKKTGVRIGRTDAYGNHYDAREQRIGYNDEYGRHFKANGENVGYTKYDSHYTPQGVLLAYDKKQ